MKFKFLLPMSLCYSNMILAHSAKFDKLETFKILTERHAPINKKGPVTCENFTGSWEGECIDSDDVHEPRSLQIVQADCYNISFDLRENGDSQKLGMTKTWSVSSMQGQYSANSYLSWNLNQTKLNRVTQLSGANYLDGFYGIAEDWDIYEMKDGNLVSHSTLVNKDLRDIPNQETYEVSCILKRKWTLKP